jgi:hypothetical protein
MSNKRLKTVEGGAVAAGGFESTEVHVMFADGDSLTVLGVFGDTTIAQILEQVCVTGRKATKLFDPESEEALDDAALVGQLFGESEAPGECLSLLAVDESADKLVVTDSCSDDSLSDLCSAGSSASVRSLDLRNCDRVSPTGLAPSLITMCFLTELSLRGLGRDGVAACADLLQQDTRLASLDISGNSFGRTVPSNSSELRALASGLRTNATVKVLRIAQNELTSDHMQVLAPAISHNTALFRLDLSNNKICFNKAHIAPGMSAIAVALENNKTLKELNIAGNYIDDQVSIALAGAIQHGGLSQLTIGADYSVKHPVTMDVSMTEANFYKKDLKASGASLIAAFIPRCQSLTSINLLFNDVGIAQARELVKLTDTMPGIGSLCGLDGAETELDFSWQGLVRGVQQPHFEACDAILLAGEIKRNSSLTHLDISSSAIHTDGCIAIAEAMVMHPSLSSFDISGSSSGSSGLGNQGIRKITAAIQSSAVLRSVSMLSTGLGIEDAQALVKVKEAKPLLRTLSGLTMEQSELSLYNKDLAPGDGLLLISDMQTNETLTSINLLRAGISARQAEELVTIKEAKPLLKTLCGFTMEETSIYLGNQQLCAADAILLASEVKEHGTLTSLNLCNNNLANPSGRFSDQPEPSGLFALAAALR